MADNLFDQFDDEANAPALTTAVTAPSSFFDEFDDDPPAPGPQPDIPASAPMSAWGKDILNGVSIDTARDSARALTKAEQDHPRLETPEEQASFWGAAEHALGAENALAYADTLDHLGDSTGDAWWHKKADAIRKSLAEDKTSYKAVYQSFRQVGGLSDAWGFAKETVGRQLGLMAPSIAGGLLGGLGGAYAGAPLGKTGEKVGAVAGSMAGAAAGNVHLQVSEMRKALMREGMKGEDLVKYTNMGATILVGLDSAFPALQAAKIGGFARKALAEKVAVKLGENLAQGGKAKTAAEFIKMFGRDLAKSTSLEVVTELAQEGLTELGSKLMAGKSVTGNDVYKFATETAPEIFVSTIISAGAIGAPGSAITSGRTVSEAKQAFAADQEFPGDKLVAPDGAEVDPADLPAPVPVDGTPGVDELAAKGAPLEVTIHPRDELMPPDARKGVSVLQFIRSKGGLTPSGELDALDAHRYPGLINKGGMTPDQVREALVEAGYLEETGPDEPSVTTPADVFDLVQRAISGERVVPVGDRAEDQTFTEGQDARDTIKELNYNEEQFVTPALEHYAEELGDPVFTKAYKALKEEDRLEVIDRVRRGEDVADVLEEVAMREADVEILQAMVAKRGPDPEIIARLRSMIAEQQPDLLTGFDDLVAALPVRRPRAAREVTRRPGDPTPALVSGMGARLRAIAPDAPIFEIAVSEMERDRKILKDDAFRVATDFLGYAPKKGTKASYFQAIRDARAAVPAKGELTTGAIAQPGKMPELPAVPVKRSATPGAIVSLIDGTKHADMSKELERRGISVEDYQRQYNLDDSYLMMAPNDIARVAAKRRDESYDQVEKEFTIGGIKAAKEAAAALDQETLLRKGAAADSASFLGETFAEDVASTRKRIAGNALAIAALGKMEAAVGKAKAEMASGGAGIRAALAEAAATAEQLEKLAPAAKLVTQYVRAAARKMGVSAADAAPARDLSAEFIQLIAGKTPRAKWGRELGLSDGQLKPYIDRAIAAGLLRRDRNGVVRRNPRAIAAGTDPTVLLAAQRSKEAVEAGFVAMAAPGQINGQDVTLTTEALGRTEQLKGIVTRAVSGILPRDVRIDVVDNIEIGRLAREDELLSLRSSLPDILDESSEEDSDGQVVEGSVAARGEGRQSGSGVAAPGAAARAGQGLPGAGAGERIPGGAAVQRIVRAESATLRADGSVFVGRQAKGERTPAGRADATAQGIGTTVRFDFGDGDYTGRVEAEPLESFDRREGNLSRLVYRVHPKGLRVTEDTAADAEMHVVQHPDGAWEIESVNVEIPRMGLGTKLYNAVEEDLGIRMSPSGVLSDEGLAFWKKRSPESVKWHQKTPTWAGFNFSPRKVKDELARVGAELSNIANGVGKSAAMPEKRKQELIAGYRKERGQLITVWAKMPEEARAATPTMFSLRAYHGSPHDFDRFSLDRIGTGEGAQVFGRGLYFAENQGVAEKYAESLAREDIYVDGKPIYVGGELVGSTGNKMIDAALADDRGNLGRTAGGYMSLVRFHRARGEDAKADELMARVREIDAFRGDIEVRSVGNLYEVEINAESEQLLDWDAPLTEQSPKVQAAIRSLGVEPVPYRNGSWLHDELFRRAAGSSYDDVSAALRDAGIPGIRYLDQGSRDSTSDPAATRNIVVFDDSLVKITHKNGKPVTAAERQALVDDLFSLRGYHSSPSDFDRFDLSKVGTGEGAQVFGHGLYFADSEKVAGSYALSVPDQQLLREAREAYSEFDDPDSALEMLLESETLTDRQKRFLSALAADDWFGFDYPHQAIRAALREDPKNWDASQETIDAIRNLSTRYEVKINAGPKDFIDWDAPLLGQPVEKKIATMHFRQVPEAERPALMQQAFASKGWSGADYYKDLARQFRSEKAASDFLAKNGIAGIRYLDRASRKAGEGTRNTVVFDDNLVEITHKDGNPVTNAERQAAVDELFSARSPRPQREPASPVQALGQTDPYGQLISIGARAVEEEARRSGKSMAKVATQAARHEALEFFRAIGLVTEPEWRNLRAAAIAEKWVDETGVRDAYTKLYKGKMPAAELEELILKEAIMEKYGAYERGAYEPKGIVRKVMKRIAEFMAIIKNGLKGEGFQTWESIFQKIDAGELRKRYEAIYGAESQSATKSAKGIDQQGVSTDPQPMIRAGQIPDARGQNPTVGQMGELRGITEIIDGLKQAIGLTQRTGRLDPALKRAARKAGGPGQAGELLGQYNGVSRTKISNDIDIISHEAGHHLERTLGGELRLIMLANQAELTPLATAMGSPLSEGFAEFFRRYVTNPSMAAARAPGFFRDFEDLLDGNHPQMLEDLQELQREYDRFLLGDPVEQGIANQTVIRGKETAFSKLLADAERDGKVSTIADRLHQMYQGVVSQNHGWWMAVRQLLEQVEARTGQRITLNAADNPNKLIRLVSHTAGWAQQDLKEGVALASRPNGGGVSMHQVLATAFGGTDRTQWNERATQEFGEYLIARRAIHLYVLHRPAFRQQVQQFVAANPQLAFLLPRLPANVTSELERPPTKESLTHQLVKLKALEQRSPQFRQAAELYYQFNKDVLALLREKHLISDDEYQRLIVDRDYAPFQRDMSDSERADGSNDASRRPARGRDKLNKHNVYKPIDGSDRDIINPIQSTTQFVYEMRLRAAINDTLRAMDALARQAGPGGNEIFERVPAHEARAIEVNIRDALRKAGKDAGMSSQDISVMLANVENQVGQNVVSTLFSFQQASEKGEKIIWFFESGKPVPIQLADGSLGRMMFESLTAVGRRNMGMLISALTAPATVVRAGVTWSFEFIFRNVLVDSVTSWVNSPYARPFLTQAAGMREVFSGGPYHQMYNRYAGMLGGESTQSLSEQSIERDVESLRQRGFHVRRPRGIMEAMKMIFQLGEFSETATRVGIFRNAMKSAIADGLSQHDAAIEAAHYAHDVMDFSRHGSKTETLRRTIPFWNAAIQGLDKYTRTLAGANDFNTLIGIWHRHRAGLPLSAEERKSVGRAAKAWTISTVVLGATSLLFSYLGEDDEDMDEIPEQIRATHWRVSVNGILYLLPKSLKTFMGGDEHSDVSIRIPKPFEMAWFANAVERAYDAAKKGDPTAFRGWLKDIWATVTPPDSIPGLDLTYGFLTGKDLYSGRDIIPTWEKDLERAEQSGPYTTWTAQQIGKAVNMSPYYVDFLVRGIGASLGRDVVSGIDMTAGALGANKSPAPSIEEFPVARRFTYNTARSSDSVGKFYDMMQNKEGLNAWFWDTVSSDARSFTAAAGTYKKFQDAGQDGPASDYLERINPDQRVYAILNVDFEKKKSKLRNLHPMLNAQEGISVANALMKEVVDGTLKVGKEKELNPLDREQMRFARNELGHIRKGMAQNGLQIMAVDGWANQQLMDVDRRIATLKSGAPEVYEELKRRLSGKGFQDFKHLAKVWPDVKSRVLTDRADAQLSDLAGGKVDAY